MVVNRLSHIKDGWVQHISFTDQNPFEIPNIHINKSDNDGYYILYSDEKLSKNYMESFIDNIKNDNLLFNYE